MAVAMLIPMIIRSIFDGHTRDHLAQFFRRLYKMIRRSDRDECIRTISYTSKNSHRGDIFCERKLPLPRGAKSVAVLYNRPA